MSANADPVELEKFNALAADWWDPRGQSAPLHHINPARLRYIQQHAGSLAGQRVLDIGCGGGILSEAMARAGAQVTALDLSDAALEVAQQHAESAGLNIDYRLQAAEDHALEAAGGYDIVTCLEMLEHVPDPGSVITACATLAKPGGQLVFSTINRNPKAFALAIFGAEYALGLVPKGTHEYSKFIRPSELDDWLRSAGLQTKNISGLQYNPLTKHARVGGKPDVNYLLYASKAN